jgi:hypothetical protein
MDQAVIRRPLTAAARVRAQVNPVGFVVEKVALWDRFFSESFGFPLSVSSHRGLHISGKKNSFNHSPIHSFILNRGRTIGP